ncbi:hypothetical protein Tco_1260017 [Tanacetum coccineum]
MRRNKIQLTPSGQLIKLILKNLIPPPLLYAAVCSFSKTRVGILPAAVWARVHTFPNEPNNLSMPLTNDPILQLPKLPSWLSFLTRIDPRWIILFCIPVRSMCSIFMKQVTDMLINRANTMAEQNVPAQPPTRTDEQIVPRSQRGSNQCLTGKTSGSDKPRHPVLQMLWEFVTQTNLIIIADMGRVTKGSRNIFLHNKYKASLKNPKKKVTPLLILYRRFSKVIIYYLARNNNIHRRPILLFITLEMINDLGNLNFVPKSASVQPATKRATPKKPTTTTPVKQTKPAPPPSKKPSKRKLPQKVRKGKPAFQLVDEEDEAQQESIPQREDDDPDLELAKKLSLETPQEKGEGEGDDADLERAIKLSLDPAFLPQGRAPIGGVTIRVPVSEATPKLHEVVGKGKAVVTEEQVAHSLVDLSKKKRTTDQFVLVR